jgi:uncharacterized protein (TIGR00645 family)
MSSNEEPQHVAPPPRHFGSGLENLMSKADRLIYETRWLLFPINVGLVLALVAYVFNFMWEDFNLLRAALTTGSENLRVLILGAVDTAMVANLLVMIIKGSHQIFIRRFENVGPNKPQWLDHIDSGILKLKVALSIASITLVQILKDFVNIEQVKWELIVHRMWIHGMCLLSALVMAIIWRVTHSNDGSHHQHAASANGAAGDSHGSADQHHG